MGLRKMFLPKLVYETLPCAYVAAGCICLYLVFGFTLIPDLMDLKSILMFSSGCVLSGVGVTILSRRVQYRRNRTVFVKDSGEDTGDHPQPGDPQSL